jgi:hypothetical protein
MDSDPISVRPTKRCIGDLEVDIPDLGEPLSKISHPVINSAQALPEQRDVGGAERVVSLRDRVWFKVKTSDHRATATELRAGEVREWTRGARAPGGSAPRGGGRTTVLNTTSMPR